MKLSLSTVLTTMLVLIIGTACDNSNAELPVLQKPIVSDVEKIPAAADAETILNFDFDNLTKDELPQPWTQSFIGTGNTNWNIIDDEGNIVLAQLYSNNPGHHYNAVVNDSIIARNMILKVRLKGVSGRHDQGGGFIWRYQDKNNYYVVRANPLEDNVVLYKVVNSIRTDLPLMGKGRTYGMDVPKLGNDWNSLKLAVKDDVFTVYLNGNELFKVQDSTFQKTGKLGFWTKADAVTYFDDFEIIVVKG